MDWSRADLLIEPQPRKCYHSARQRLRKRRLDFPPFLEGIDTTSLETDRMITEMIYMSGSYSGEGRLLGQEGWGRSLLLFSKLQEIGEVHDKTVVETIHNPGKQQEES